MAKRADRIQTNYFFEKAMKSAQNFYKNPPRSIKLIQRAVNKIREKGITNLNYQERGEDIFAMARMLRDYFKGMYTHVPVKFIIKMLAAMIYVVWVIDLIPDFIFGIGYTDDLAVLLWVAAAVKDEIDRFREWEHEKKPKEIEEAEVQEETA